MWFCSEAVAVSFVVPPSLGVRKLPSPTEEVPVIARTRRAALAPCPYFITPNNRDEARFGKPLLLTNYEIDELTTALLALGRGNFDPDLMLKLRVLRHEVSD